MATRRKALWTSTAGAALTLLPSGTLFGQKSPNQRLRIAVMGLSRGMAHVRSWQKVPNVEVAAICDVDEKRAAKGLEEVAKNGGQAKAEGDLRKILADPDIDVLSIAAPNHWHAPATLMALAAGKHVYVEKPGSHNAAEAVQVARRTEETGLKVQLGTQRRSLPAYAEAVARLREGVIGEVRTARCWYANARGSIGTGQPAAVPPGLDYELWQGPAPRRDFKDNLIHYNWHWHWHWGGGELANNGVHALDIARWGLGVDLPDRVVCQGGRYHFEDDQETPDTIMAMYDFGGNKTISWEGSSCHPRKAEPLPFVKFYGDKGSLSLSTRSKFSIYDNAGQEIGKAEDEHWSDVPHFQNLADAIRDGVPLTADVRDSNHAATLCHLGNMAYRTGGSLDFDPATASLRSNPAAEKLWAREYAKGWGIG